MRVLKKLVSAVFFFIFTATLFSESRERSLHQEKLRLNSETQGTALKIRSNVRGAEVYIDYHYAGRTPVYAEVVPGAHFIEIKKEHYIEQSLYETVFSGQVKDVYFVLKRMTGIISISCNVSDAEFYIDSERVYKKQNEVEDCPHTVTVKKFGYEVFSKSVYVLNRQIVDVHASLEEAQFEIQSLSCSKKSFNPQNIGLLGTIDIHFSVNAPAEGVLEIFNPNGLLVFTQKYSFSKWNYTYTWNGRDKDENELPDGIYTVRLIAEDKKILCAFNIDSSITYPLTVLGPNGTGIGTFAAPLMFPDETVIFTMGSGYIMNCTDDKSFYAVPVFASMGFQITDYVEFAGHFNFLVDKESAEFTGKLFPPIDIKRVLTCGLSLKICSDVKLSDELKFNFGGLVRFGASNDSSFYPYGVDSVNGLSLGAMLGFSTKTFYAGLSSQFTFSPVEGLQADGNDKTLKSGIAVYKTIEVFGFGFYCAAESSWGTYEQTEKSDGVGKTVLYDISDSLRVIDAGFQINVFIGNSGSQFSVTAGTIIYPGSETYFYTKAACSHVF